MDSRIAIVGANGTGKSTLLNLITGQLQPTRGSLNRHPGLKLAKYSQHSADQLPYDKSPLEYFEGLYKAKYPDKEIQFWRSQLGRFGLSGAHQVRPRPQDVSDPRRRARSATCRTVCAIVSSSRCVKPVVPGLQPQQLSMENPHILLLDEPTNHLDMESIDALAECVLRHTRAR